MLIANRIHVKTKLAQPNTRPKELVLDTYIFGSRSYRFDEMAQTGKEGKKNEAKHDFPSFWSYNLSLPSFPPSKEF